MYNEQAEMAILGSILKDNTIIKELSLTTEHFYSYQNKRIYEVMVDIAKQNNPIDVVTIRQSLGQEYNSLGGSSYIRAIQEYSAPNNFMSYQNIIINAWKSREINTVLQKMVEKKDYSQNRIQSLIAWLNKIDQTGTKEMFNLKQHLSELMDLPYKEVPKGYSGIASGFKDLDNMTDGFQDEDSIIIGARPSMGKTALMLNIATNAGKSGVIPVIFSLEMSASSLIKRMLSSLAGINGIKVRNPYHYFSHSEKDKWVLAIGELDRIKPYIFDESKQTVNSMRAKVREVKNLHPGKKIIVLIDYLTLIKPMQEHNGNSHLQVSEISSDLKAMAKEFKVPVITLAQLSRGVEQRADKHPTMSDLRESGSIEQDADVIMFLYRDEYYSPNTDLQNVLEINIAKQRNGPVGRVYLHYNKELNRIGNRA